MRTLSGVIFRVVATALAKEVMNPGLALAVAADNPEILYV